MLIQTIARLCLGALILLAASPRDANVVSCHPQDECQETDNPSCNPTTTHENVIDTSLLETLEIAPAALAGEEIDEQVYELKLPPSTRATLLDYCNDVGITKRFQQLLKEPLQVNTNIIESFGKETGEWFLQRPDWFSDDDGQDNVHWLSPLNHEAYENYLQVLGDADFDDALQSIGEYFELESLVVYSVSFHAVSHVQGEQHHIQLDLVNTNDAAWNIVIPLLLPIETEPELAIIESDEERVLKYQFQDNVALLVGEDVNYYLTKFASEEMRLVATISVADVSIHTVDAIVETYLDQPFPPKDDAQWLYDHAGEHWMSEMDEVSLPKHSDTKAERLERTNNYHESRMPRRQQLPEEMKKVDRHYADRLVRGAIDALHDPDCMSREFDVSSNAFNADSATRVLQKCKVLVLRNVFDKTFLNEYRDDFADFIMAIHNGTIAASGTTTNNENYFLHQIAHKRWEVILPRTFAHEDLIMDRDIMNILLQRNILGRQMVLHSLGTALAEPGAEAQTWHNDDDYLFNDLFSMSGIGGHDLPSYAVTMMVPLLNMTSEHGPTEFCIGSSHLFALGDSYPDSVPLKDESLRPILKKYMYGSREGLCPFKRRIPQLNFGDVLLFDYQILHRGGANNSPDLRSIMYMTFAREWYKDKNFRKPINYDNYYNEWDALYYQLTRSARFAIPGDDDAGQEESGMKPMDSLESIQQFLPPRY